MMMRRGDWYKCLSEVPFVRKLDLASNSRDGLTRHFAPADVLLLDIQLGE
jgi:hypothetical protein